MCLSSEAARERFCPDVTDRGERNAAPAACLTGGEVFTGGLFGGPLFTAPPPLPEDFEGGFDIAISLIFGSESLLVA